MSVSSYDSQPYQTMGYISDSDSDSDSNNSYSSHFLLVYENHRDLIQKCTDAHTNIAQYIASVEDDTETLMQILEITRKILHLPFPENYSNIDHIKRPWQNDFEPLFDQINTLIGQERENVQHFVEMIRTFYWAHMEVVDQIHYNAEENMTCREYQELWDDYV